MTEPFEGAAGPHEVVSGDSNEEMLAAALGTGSGPVVQRKCVSPAGTTISNVLTDGALVIDGVDAHRATIETHLAADRDDIITAAATELASMGPAPTGADQAAIQHRAKSNALEAITASDPTWFRVMMPLFDVNDYVVCNEDGTLGSAKESALGWFMFAPPFEERKASRDALGTWSPSAQQIRLMRTNNTRLSGASVSFSKAPMAEVLATLVHEVQHMLDPDTYQDTTGDLDAPDWQNSLIRFRREFRAHYVAGQIPGPGEAVFVDIGSGNLPSPTTADLGVDDTIENRVMLRVLGRYETKEDASVALLDLYLDDGAFRTECIEFAASFREQSINLTSSPEVDELRAFVTDNWTGVELAWEDKPWGELERLIDTLSDTDKELIRASEPWQELAERSFIHGEDERFWSLF